MVVSPVLFGTWYEDSKFWSCTLKRYALKWGKFTVYSLIILTYGNPNVNIIYSYINIFSSDTNKYKSLNIAKLIIVKYCALKKVCYYLCTHDIHDHDILFLEHIPYDDFVRPVLSQCPVLLLSRPLEFNIFVKD